MTDQSPIEQATRRLSRALDALDAALERKHEIDRSRSVLVEQMHALDADRARLAADLDKETARTRRLETANRDIAQRLDAAMDNIRQVLETQD